MLSSFAGGRLFGARYGTGDPAVVALHGWRRTHRDWSPVLEGLDAVALDLPGFGASPPPDRPWGIEDFASAVGAVLADMGRPVVVAGHSFGGSVAVHLAAGPSATHVGALLLTGSPLIRRVGSARPSLGFRAARWLHARRLFPEARMEAMRRARGSADYRAASGVMRDTLVRVVNEDVSELLSRVSIPVSLVWGEHDADVPADVAREAAGLMPSAAVRLLSGVGHDTLAEAPDALREELLALTPHAPRRP